MSKTVRDRAQRCLTVILAGYAYAGVLGEAATRMMRDFLRREAEQAAAALAAGGTPPESPRAPSIRDLLRLGARDLEQCRDAMIEADDVLERSRADLRRWRRRRDRRAQRLYEYLAGVRKFFKGLLGYDAANVYLGIKGPTPRDPHALLRDARHVTGVLGDPSKAPACSFAHGGRLKTSDLAAGLGALCDPLTEALASVTAAGCAEVAAQEHQRRAVADLDRLTKHTARLFERALDYFGLPTLAATVRPGVKRRGRPPKVQPADLFPDLVEQALGRGVLEAGDAASALARITGVETALPAADPAEPHSPVPTPIENLEAGRDAASGPKARGEEIPSGLRKPAERDQKIETAPRKAAEHDPKIETASRKPSERDQKIETGPRKPAEPWQKSETGPRKPEAAGSSLLNGTFTTPIQIRNRRSRIVHRVEPRRRRRSPRDRRSGASPGLAASASALWRRFRGRAS